MGEKARKTKLGVVLDTHSLVTFFKGEPGIKTVREILRGIKAGEIIGYISVVTSSELLYILARYKDLEFSRAVLKHLRLSGIKLVEVSEEIAELGGEFKFKYAVGGMPLADTIIAATAVSRNAILVSDDPHFKKIKEIKSKTLKDVKKLLI